MRQKLPILYLVIFLGACAGPNTSIDERTATSDTITGKAELIIEAFYSFDPSQLRPLLLSAQESLPVIMYYQGWAEGGNYQVLERKSCLQIGVGRVECSITVEDDPVLALGTGYKVTDTFEIVFNNGEVTSVDTSSDDQQVYYDARKWVEGNLPELIEVPCKGAFGDGLTPGDCARAVVEGFAQFAASDDFSMAKYSVTTNSTSAYSIVPHWPDVPKNFSMGQATGVAVDSHNHVFIFHRASREWVDPFPIETISEDTVLMFDGDTGELKNSWGGGLFIMPHGLSVDKDNNIWLTDVGSQQIHKLSHDGELLLSIGEAGVIGNDNTHFGLPSDLTILADGSVYVSDGYANTRIIKLDSSGTFNMQWGTPGDQSGAFDLPHGIAANNNRIYVADRGNSRLQIFDNQGAYITKWKAEQVGRPYGVAVSGDEKVFIIDGGDQPYNTRSRVVILDTEGKVLDSFSAENESDLNNLGHDIALGADGAVYVVDAWARSVRKYTSKK